MVDVNQQQPATPAPQWAIVEIFGHTRLAGQIAEETQFGATFIRVDVPTTKDGVPYSRLFGGQAIFSITPCDEAMARRVAAAVYHPLCQFLPKDQTPAALLIADRTDDPPTDSDLSSYDDPNSPDYVPF